VVGACVVAGWAGTVVTFDGSGPVVSDGAVGACVVVDPAVVGGRGCVDVLSTLPNGMVSSLLSSSPPVKTMRAMIPRMTAAAPAATAMIAPGCCHQGPGGGSYSGSYCQSPPGGTPPASPPPACGCIVVAFGS
jgi:hypothetical protein